MKAAIEIKDHQLQIDLSEVFKCADIDEKKELIRSLSLQSDVIQSVTDYICGEDAAGAWTSDEPDMRQNILERIEKTHLGDLKNGLRYGWSVWSDIQMQLRQIREKQHIYWKLHHSEDEWTRANAWEFFKRNKIESDYTTRQADADIARVETIIKEHMARMDSK